MAGLVAPIAASAQYRRLFIVDSTQTLFSYDIDGDLVGKAKFSGPVGYLNGGGITTDTHNVYVTLGEPTNSVIAFDKESMAAVELPHGSFSGLFVPRGIVFDPHNQQFYIANGGSSVNVCDKHGTSIAVSGGFPLHYGPSGAAFDAENDTIWIANYFGATQGLPPQYSVTQYNEDGSAAASFDYAHDFVPPHKPQFEQPYAIGYCGIEKGSEAALVIVGFKSDTSGRGVGEGQVYSVKGRRFRHQFMPSLQSPNALSCTNFGHLYVADDSGLRRFDRAGHDIGLPSGGFPGLTAPVYGVFFDLGRD